MRRLSRRYFSSEMRALALIALHEWDLAVADLAPIKVRENAVFRIDLADGGRAVLRVHRGGYHSDAELDSEFVWMRALASGRHPGSARDSLPARPGFRGHRDVEQQARQIDVFEWIEGRQLGSVESGIGGDGAAIAEQYQTIGAIAARMHNHTADWRPPAGFRRHAWDAAGLVGEQPLWGRFWELAALTPAEMKLLTRVRATIAADLQDYGTVRSLRAHTCRPRAGKSAHRRQSRSSHRFR